jgi:hypothetical protein
MLLEGSSLKEKIQKHMKRIKRSGIRMCFTEFFCVRTRNLRE